MPASAEREAEEHAGVVATDPDVVGALERRLEFDFAGVRIHHTHEAHQLNERFGSRAFTHGNDIYFGRGEEDLELTSGRRLLAHELVHVAQQHQWGTAIVQRAAKPAGGAPASSPSPARPGRIIREWRAPDGIAIEMEIGDAVQRMGLEKTLPSGTEVSLAGWQRAHSIGPGLGAESGEGIRYAPPEVNLGYQNSGIEQFIREFNKARAPEARLFLRTVTQTHPDSLRLKNITYQLSAARGDERPKMLFEVEISIANETDSPKVTLGKPEILGDWTEYLAPEPSSQPAERGAEREAVPETRPVEAREPLVPERAAGGAVEAGAFVVYAGQVALLVQQVHVDADAELQKRSADIESLRRQGEWVLVSMVVDEPASIDVLGWSLGVPDPGQIPYFKFLIIDHGRTREEALNPPTTIGPAPPGMSRVAEPPEMPAKGRVWRTYPYVTYPPLRTSTRGSER